MEAKLLIKTCSIKIICKNFFFCILLINFRFSSLKISVHPLIFLTMLTQDSNAAIIAANELRPLFKGKILVDGDADFDVARKIWNGMIDRRPAVILQCLDKNDIIQAVKFARKNNLLVSVRGGGHNVSGNAV